MRQAWTRDDVNAAVERGLSWSADRADVAGCGLLIGLGLERGSG